MFYEGRQFGHLILLGAEGQRVLVDFRRVDAVEEVTGEDVGVRLQMASGQEIDVWGLSMDQFLEEIRKAYAH